MARNYKSVSKHKGFTLVELMIAVAIVGILVTIAVPSYSGAMQQSRRSVAMAELSSLVLFMERTYSENLSYQPGGTSPTLPFIASPKTGSDKFYDLTVASTATTYTLTATPKGAQTSDTCGTLTINHIGVHGAGSTKCW